MMQAIVTLVLLALPFALIAGAVALLIVIIGRGGSPR
jgi:hypothetical protein